MWIKWIKTSHSPYKEIHNIGVLINDAVGESITEAERRIQMNSYSFLSHDSLFPLQLMPNLLSLALGDCAFLPTGLQNGVFCKCPKLGIYNIRSLWVLTVKHISTKGSLLAKNKLATLPLLFMSYLLLPWQKWCFPFNAQGDGRMSSYPVSLGTSRK